MTIKELKVILDKLPDTLDVMVQNDDIKYHIEYVDELYEYFKGKIVGEVYLNIG